jgi:hypothetical protein
MYQQIQGLNTDEKGLEISKIWRWIVQNTTLMSFKQLCQIWTCKINSTKCPFSMSNNFIKYPKTKARKILRLSSTSLQIQGHSRPWMFVFKFKGIEGLSSFVRTLTNVDQWKKSAFRKHSRFLWLTYLIICLNSSRPSFWLPETSYMSKNNLSFSSGVPVMENGNKHQNLVVSWSPCQAERSGFNPWSDLCSRS